jgi:hypothetical protein
MSRVARTQNYKQKFIKDLAIGLIQKLRSFLNVFAREEC